MHLRQLKIKNLASLRGEHTVEFDTLSGQDLFAITGETGAGKSTLLNALSLALYGRLYKRQLVQSDLVTLGEREASIALTFTAKGISYLATWSTVVRKKDGTLLGNPRTERFFYQLVPDAPLNEARVLEVTPEAVLQLDFEQFCKCVVLNQGEFAKFLTASFSERRDILERLYPSDNIDSIGGLARKKFEDRKQQANTLETQAHTLQEETLFDIEAVKLEQSRSAIELQQVEEQFTRLRPLTQVLNTLLTQTQLHNNARTSLAETHTVVSERTVLHNEAMSTWQALHQKLTEAQRMWDSERPQLEVHIQQAQDLKRQQDTWQSLQQQEAELLRQRALWAERLSQLQERGKQQTERLAGLVKGQQRFPILKDWTVIDVRAIGTLIQRDQLLAQQWNQGTQGLQLIEQEGKQLKDKCAELEKTIARQLQDLPEHWRKLSSTDRQKEFSLARQTETQRQLLQHAHHANQTELKHLLPQVQESRRQLADLSWLSTLHELREQLVHQHPQGTDHCPVCEQGITPALWAKLTTHWEQDRHNQQLKQLQVLRDTGKQLEASEAGLTKQVHDLEKQLAALPPAIAHFERTEETQLALIKREENLREIQAQVEQSRQRWKTENDKLQRLGPEREQIRHDLGVWQTKATHLFGQAVDWNPATLTELQHDFELYRQYQEGLREGASFQAQAEQLQQDLNELTPRLVNLTEQQTQLVAAIKVGQDNLRQIYGESTPQERSQQRTEELRSLTQRDQVLQNESRLRERSLGEVRAKVGALTDQMKNIELLFAQETEKLAPLLGRQIQLPIDEAHPILTPLAAENAQALAAFEDKLKLLTQKLAELNTLFKKDQAMREKRDHLRKDLARVQTEVDRFKRLMDVLGQDDLRTYVLSLVEAALIQQTNVELQKLCGARYEVQHSVRKGKLAPEFWVIDRWRDGLLRKVTTLSGGETFMVSLAMALALAEMTRGKADIDCFFIDEGFGTLDEDSLDGVLEMLQQVRSRGKQIGLITHVKALSGRLPLNLHLQKDPRGNSTVSVVWN